MIHQGSGGSITFFYNDKLIASSALTKKKSVERHYLEAGNIIVDGMRSGITLLEVKSLFAHSLDLFCKRKKITREDERYIVMIFMALIKLNYYDIDDVALIMKRK
tara:strand:+ start:554 stop:868 length:315 start_codon:yes stop_codon:yes gene_type:complete